MLTPKEQRGRRIALGLSLEDLARVIGAEPPLLAKMESGDALISQRIGAVLKRLERQRRTGNTGGPVD